MVINERMRGGGQDWENNHGNCGKNVETNILNGSNGTPLPQEHFPTQNGGQHVIIVVFLVFGQW